VTLLPLYLLAAHLVGDFVLQTRWQSASKLTDRGARMRHVTVYTAAFIPVVAAVGPGRANGYAFLSLLWLSHFLTDSRRFKSTLGDVIAWRRVPSRRTEWQEHMRTGSPYIDSQPVPEEWLAWPPPNPWQQLPIVLDQTLHVVQLAVLAGVFLA
jgi:hypothetical protein